MKAKTVQKTLGLMVFTSGICFLVFNLKNMPHIGTPFLEVFCKDMGNFLLSYLIMLIGALLVVVDLEGK